MKTEGWKWGLIVIEANYGGSLVLFNLREFSVELAIGRWLKREFNWFLRFDMFSHFMNQIEIGISFNLNFG